MHTLLRGGSQRRGWVAGRRANSKLSHVPQRNNVDVSKLLGVSSYLQRARGSISPEKAAELSEKVRLGFDWNKNRTYAFNVGLN